MTKLGERIIKLRNSGKSFKQIAETLHCSTSTVSYYCSPGQKIKAKKRKAKKQR